jgi:hypothetical protein
MWSYFTRQRSSQLIVEPRGEPIAARLYSQLDKRDG